MKRLVFILALNVFVLLPNGVSESNIPLQQEPSEMGILDGHITAVTGLSFSPDGSLLASSGDDVSVRLWDVESMTQVAESYEHGSFVKSMKFSPRVDEWQLASSSWDRRVITYDVAANGTLAVQKTLPPQDAVIEQLVFSPSGDLLAYSVGDGTVMIADALSLESQQTIPVDNLRITALAFTPDTRYLVVATGFPDDGLLLWSLEDETGFAELSGYEGAVTSATFGTDEELFVGTTAGQIVLWDMSDVSDPVVSSVLEIDDWVTAIVYDPVQNVLFTASLDGVVHREDIKSSGFITVVQYDSPVISLALSPDGLTLAIGTEDGLIYLWDVS